MHFNASRSLTQPLLDCILYLTQYFDDPGLPIARHFTKLCKLVYPWESVSEIQSTKDAYMGYSDTQSCCTIKAHLSRIGV